jgi:hypothetical protein
MGRTATVAACLLKVLDKTMTVEKALTHIHQARAGTMKDEYSASENELQVEAIKCFYKHIDDTLGG